MGGGGGMGNLPGLLMGGYPPSKSATYAADKIVTDQMRFVLLTRAAIAELKGLVARIRTL